MTVEGRPRRRTTDALAREPRFVDPRCYTSPSFATQEFATMWRQTWQVVGREHEIAEPGTYIVYTIGSESIIITRDQEGDLHAFSNVCRHRGMLLKCGTGRAAQLRCPFHGWTYDLGGFLQEVPASWDFPHVDATTHSLPTYHVDSWAGFLFVNLDPEAPSLTEFLGELPAMTERFGLEGHVRWLSVATIIPANWKLCLEAFIESYHAPTTHPQSVTFSDEANATYELFGAHSRMVMPTDQSESLKVPVDERTIVEDYAQLLQCDPDSVRYVEGASASDCIVAIQRRTAEERGWDTSFMTDSEVLDVWQYHLFPNVLYFTGFGGFGIYFRFLPSGTDPASSVIEINALRVVAEGEQRPPDVETTLYPEGTTFVEMFGNELLGRVFDQDVSNLRLMQQGLQSAALDVVTLGMYQESRIRRFHEILDRYRGADDGSIDEDRTS